MNAAPRLSARARAAVEEARRLVARDEALVRLTRTLDPEARRSLWSVAHELAGLLRRFEGSAFRRIAAGHRAARGYEAELMALCVPECPRSAGRLFRLLQDVAQD